MFRFQSPFSYRAAFRAALGESLFIIPPPPHFVNTFFQLFSKFFAKMHTSLSVHFNIRVLQLYVTLYEFKRSCLSVFDLIKDLRALECKGQRLGKKH